MAAVKSLGRVAMGNNKTKSRRSLATTNTSPHKGRKKTTMKKELADTIEHANRKLVNITRGGFPVNFADVEIKAEESDLGLITIISGVTQIAYAGENGFVDLKKAIWRVVDQTRKQVEALTGPTGIDTREPEQKIRIPEIDGIKDVISEVEGFIAGANHSLEEVVADGFPFSFEEVVMTMTYDSAGIYVHSGLTPVCAVARAGNPERALEEIENAILDMVDDIRTAVERRGNLKEEFESIVAESEKRDKAAEALVAAGLDASILGGGVNAEAAEAVLNAAKKGVKEANKRLTLTYGKAVEVVGNGDWRNTKLKVKGFSGGLVVLAGDKPCLITHYPKIVNNKTVENMILHMVSDIKSLGDSRRRYLERVMQDMERENRLHEIAQKLDAANEQLMAAAM